MGRVIDLTRNNPKDQKREEKMGIRANTEVTRKTPEAKAKRPRFLTTGVGSEWLSGMLEGFGHMTEKIEAVVPNQEEHAVFMTAVQDSVAKFPEVSGLTKAVADSIGRGVIAVTSDEVDIPNTVAVDSLNGDSLAAWNELQALYSEAYDCDIPALKWTTFRDGETRENSVLGFVTKRPRAKKEKK